MNSCWELFLFSRNNTKLPLSLSNLSFFWGNILTAKHLQGYYLQGCCFDSYFFAQHKKQQKNRLDANLNSTYCDSNAFWFDSYSTCKMYAKFSQNPVSVRTKHAHTPCQCVHTHWRAHAQAAILLTFCIQSKLQFWGVMAVTSSWAHTNSWSTQRW